MHEWTRRFAFALPGLQPFCATATASEVVVLARGVLVDRGSQAAPYESFTLHHVCFDLASRAERWRDPFVGADTMWRLDPCADGLLVWDEMGDRGRFFVMADGRAHDHPLRLEEGEHLALVGNDIWLTAENLVRRVDARSAASITQWRCGEWQPRAACEAHGLCWLACVSSGAARDCALLAIDPAARAPLNEVRLTRVENLLHLVMVNGCALVLGASVDPAAPLPGLPDELRDLEGLADAANQPGLRGWAGKFRLYKRMLSSLGAFAKSSETLHELGAALIAQPAVLSCIAFDVKNGAERWRQSLAPRDEAARRRDAPRPTGRGGFAFLALSRSILAMEAQHGTMTAHEFAGHPLALPDEKQPYAWIAEEGALAAWEFSGR